LKLLATSVAPMIVHVRFIAFSAVGADRASGQKGERFSRRAGCTV
jgi:hypothetical protein